MTRSRAWSATARLLNNEWMDQRRRISGSPRRRGCWLDTELCMRRLWSNADGSRGSCRRRSGGLKRKTTAGCSQQWANAPSAMRARLWLLRQSLSSLRSDIAPRDNQDPRKREGKTRRQRRQYLQQSAGPVEGRRKWRRQQRKQQTVLRLRRK